MYYGRGCRRKLVIWLSVTEIRIIIYGVCFAAPRDLPPSHVFLSVQTPVSVLLSLSMWFTDFPFFFLFFYLFSLPSVWVICSSTTTPCSSSLTCLLILPPPFPLDTHYLHSAILPKFNQNTDFCFESTSSFPGDAAMASVLVYPTTLKSKLI